jgi:YHS domain-containing protein
MKSMAQDPICGRRVDESSRYSSVYKGARYFFCSACCKEIFDAVPEEIEAWGTAAAKQPEPDARERSAAA